jgi:hypothetical protein
LNDKALKQFSLPWFLPESLCGLGLPCVGRYQPAKYDLQIARKLVENPHKFKMPSFRAKVPWSVWRYAQSRLPRNIGSAMLNMRDIDMREQDAVSLKTLTGLFCVEALFRVGVSDIFDNSKQLQVDNYKMSLRYFQSLFNLWNRLRHDQTLPLRGPLNVTTFKRVDLDDLPLVPIVHNADDVLSAVNIYDILCNTRTLTC